MDKVKRHIKIISITIAAGALVAFILPCILLKVLDYQKGQYSNAAPVNDTGIQNQGEQIDSKMDEYAKKREEARNQGRMLESAPKELTDRIGITYEGIDSISKYYGASEPVKVKSSVDEFVNFCDEFFFDHTKPVNYMKWADETASAQCGKYIVVRTELYNPEVKNGQLRYIFDAGQDGQSVAMEFVYDTTGKYALMCHDFDETVACAMAKFMGLKFDDEHPYISPVDEVLEALSVRSEIKKWNGNIWDYKADENIVRVNSTEDEFIEFCEDLFKDTGVVEYYYDYKNEANEARCGQDYLIIRTQYFTPEAIPPDYDLYYEEITGDTEPFRTSFFYDSTGKYALVYFGEDTQDEVCRKFLGV